MGKLIALLLLASSAIAAEPPVAPEILRVDEVDVLKAQVEILNRDNAQLRAAQAQLKILIDRGQSWDCKPPAPAAQPK